MFISVFFFVFILIFKVIFTLVLFVVVLSVCWVRFSLITGFVQVGGGLLGLVVGLGLGKFGVDGFEVGLCGRNRLCLGCWLPRRIFRLVWKVDQLQIECWVVVSRITVCSIHPSHHSKMAITRNYLNSQPLYLCHSPHVSTLPCDRYSHPIFNPCRPSKQRPNRCVFSTYPHPPSPIPPWLPA